jgi:RNA polymerase sigma factor (sigma-70 family)
MVGEAEAEEVVQDAFERAIREPNFFERVREPSAWLRAVATRGAIDRLRRRRILERLHFPVRTRDLDGEAADRVDLRRSLRKLPPKQRAAIVLRYYDDVDYETIARILDMEPASVGPLLSRARAALRGALTC